MGRWRPYGRQIARLGLDASIDLRLGYIPNDETHLYFGAADVTVLPYREILQSGVILAAYTFERPVIATRVGGMPELVHEDVTGHLVPPGDPDALANACLRAISNRGGLVRMGAAAAAFMRKRHSWQQIAASHETIYELAMRTDSDATSSARRGSGG